MARRNVEVFSLSFLDVICCGFGAVILFYTIISAQSGIERTRKAEDLSATVSKLEEEVITGAKNLVVLRNTLQKTESETISASSRATQLIEELQRKREESFIYDAETLAKRERIEKLKADVKALEESSRRLEASAKIATPRGELTGAGKSRASRRYITGLTLKGRRILVLFDRSASMLDEDLVNIIRLRNSPPAAQQGAEKWRRATDIASWIVNEIPDASQYQFYAFNTTATAMGQLAPAGGTSLINAFAAIRDMKVPPDQVILITDGLPTQGASTPAIRKLVKAETRVQFFLEAIRSKKDLPPVSVILLPMKGDTFAANRFWDLAIQTKGEFLMPSPDWP
ncbi:MAG: VWA domain-containing protein [Gammaproteobacteria bacterium]|nr:VWA domain-containing protein [Gammaproteobacteria bacterium]